MGFWRRRRRKRRRRRRGRSSRAVVDALCDMEQIHASASGNKIVRVVPIVDSNGYCER